MFNTTSSVEMITKLVGTHVKINFGGTEANTGTLLAVKSDYLVLHSDQDDVIYYQLTHIKGISINPLNSTGKQSNKGQHHSGESFKSILKGLVHKRVKINSGGPKSVEGVLNRTNSHLIEVTGDNTVLFISIHHIKSIHHVSKKSSKSRNKRTSKEKINSGKTQLTKNSSFRNQHSRLSSGNDVLAALAMATQVGTEQFMHNDPTGSSNRSGQSHQRTRSINCSDQSPAKSLQCTQPSWDPQRSCSIHSHESSRAHKTHSPKNIPKLQSVNKRQARPLGEFFRI